MPPGTRAPGSAVEPAGGDPGRRDGPVAGRAERFAGALWFFSVGLGASRLAGTFARPAAWRVLDLTVAAVTVALAVSLLIGAGSG